MAARVLRLIMVAAIAATAQPARPTTIRTPGFPTSVAAAFGSIWITSHRDTLLYRIDPATNHVVAKVDLSQNLCWTPTSAGGALWVSNCEGSDTAHVYRIDPTHERIIGRAPGNAPAAGDGSLWTVDDSSTVYRIDPRSTLVLARIRVPALQPYGPNNDPYVGGVAYGSVWIAGCTTVARVSTKSNRIVKVFKLPDERGCPAGNVGDGYFGADRMAFVHGHVFVAAPRRMFEIDVATNRVQATPIVLQPHLQWGDDNIDFAVGALWVRTSDNSVTRIDPTTLRIIHRYRAEGGGGEIAIAFHSLWVVNAYTETVWREPLG